MQANLGSLRVTKIIIHDVPRRLVQQSGPGVTFSQVESTLTPESANYFREKIIGSLLSAGHDVRFICNSSSPVPRLLFEFINGGTGSDFVCISQEIAQHLYDSQTGANSPGLLCLAEVSLESNPGVAILKLNRETAVQVEPTTIAGGVTFNLEHVQNLILSNRAKVFKAGLFATPGPGGSLTGMEGRVSDNQRSYAPTADVADFFLKTFLGCELLEAPDVSTKEFL